MLSPGARHLCLHSMASHVCLNRSHVSVLHTLGTAPTRQQLVLPANWALAVGTVERPLLGGRPRHLCGKVEGHPGGGLHLIHQTSCTDST